MIARAFLSFGRCRPFLPRGLSAVGLPRVWDQLFESHLGRRISFAYTLAGVAFLKNFLKNIDSAWVLPRGIVSSLPKVLGILSAPVLRPRCGARVAGWALSAVAGADLESVSEL
jgi:hypothetical protein